MFSAGLCLHYKALILNRNLIRTDQTGLVHVRLHFLLIPSFYLSICFWTTSNRRKQCVVKFTSSSCCFVSAAGNFGEVVKNNTNIMPMKKKLASSELVYPKADICVENDTTFQSFCQIRVPIFGSGQFQTTFFKPEQNATFLTFPQFPGVS